MRKREGREGEIGFSLLASCEVESLSSRSPHFEVCGFSLLHLGVSVTDEVVTIASECQKEGRCRASRRISTYSYHKQKSSATWQKSTDAFSDHCAILRTGAQQGDMRPAAALASALPPLLEAAICELIPI